MNFFIRSAILHAIGNLLNGLQNLTQSRVHEAKYVLQISKKTKSHFLFCRELFRRAANLASNEDLNKILTNTFIVLGHMFFRMHSYQVRIKNKSFFKYFILFRKVQICFNRQQQWIQKGLLPLKNTFKVCTDRFDWKGNNQDEHANRRDQVQTHAAPK